MYKLTLEKYVKMLNSINGSMTSIQRWYRLSERCSCLNYEIVHAFRERSLYDPRDANHDSLIAKRLLNEYAATKLMVDLLWLHLLSSEKSYVAEEIAMQLSIMEDENLDI